MSDQGTFAIDLPAGWFRVDIEPATRDRSAEALVDGWVARHPDLAEHRAALVAMLVATGAHAKETGCVYAAAAFGEQRGCGPSYVGLAVRVLRWPGPMEVADFLDGMAAAARGDDAVTGAEVVHVGGRRMLLVRQTVETGDGAAPAAVTSFVVPDRGHGVFANLEFSSPVAPAPEHTFAHIAASVRLG